MLSKSNQKIVSAQYGGLPAGTLPGDHNTELFANRDTHRVFALNNGSVVPFAHLHPVIIASISAMLHADAVALFDLRHIECELDKLETFAYCIFGAADGNPDFDEMGNPGPPENFMCGENCVCLGWASKKLMLCGTPLTPRQLQLLPLIAGDDTDAMVAHKMGITVPTLDFHKKKLMNIAGVRNRTALVRMAMAENLV